MPATGIDPPHIPCILEAERLLKEAVAREPDNAEAWNIYLASYWRFSFAAVGREFGMTRLSGHQAKLIETAAASCPEDECIKLWLALRRSPPDKRDTIQPFEAIRRRGLFDLDYPKLNYGYWGCNLTGQLARPEGSPLIAEW